MSETTSKQANKQGLVGPAINEAPQGEVTLTPPWQSNVLYMVCLLVWCVFWDLACVALQFQETTPLAIKVIFPLIGAGMTQWALRLLLVRHAWKVCLGRITRRMRVLLTGLAWEKRYEGVIAIEFRRGVWESGEGYTDVLRFRVPGHATPVELDGLYYDFDQVSHAGEWVAATEEREQELGRSLGFREQLRTMWHAMDDSMKELGAATEENEQALGRFIAERVGVPYIVVEEHIPDPSSD